MTNEQHMEILFIDQISRIVSAINGVSKNLENISESLEGIATSSDIIRECMDLSDTDSQMGGLELIAKQLSEIKENVESTTV